MLKIKVGDKVIKICGKEGVVTGVCQCNQCKARGYFEQQIKYNDGTYDNISVYDAQNGYDRWYRIGTTTFVEHVNIDDLHDIINRESQQIEVSNRNIADALRLIFRMDTYK